MGVPPPPRGTGGGAGPAPPQGRLSVRHRPRRTARPGRRRMVAADERRRSRRLDRGPVKVLTDTHTLVWALTGPEPLGAAARAALAGSPFTASVANPCELVPKPRKPGALVADPLPWWEKYVIAPRIPTLAIRTAHIRRLAGF